MRALSAARKAARKALEATYEGVCNIIEYRDTEDEETGLSGETEEVVMENQPCRLSFETLAPASQTETAASVSQKIKLFLAPEIAVPAGSKIVVTQNGVTGEYSASGVPAVYETHQEIMLDLYKRWA